MRGPCSIPARCSSLDEKMPCVSLDGSCSVVTPKASEASSSHDSPGWISSPVMPPCQCTSTMPGMIVAPRTSTTLASAGTATFPRAPMPVIRLPRTTRTPSSMT